MSGLAKQIKDKRTQPIVRAAEKAGWKIRKSKSAIILYPPNGSRPISVHRSNRDGRRSNPNALVQAKRAGLVL